MTIEILTPVGRMVAGHPMESHAVKDDKTKQPKVNVNGEPLMSTTVGLAIPKNGEQHWNQTEWGALIYNEAVQSFPKGDYNVPSFSWKIVDGDSMVPNKQQKIPAEREGYAGNWIIFASNGFPVSCYHVNRYEPHQVIQNKAEIKKGDYVRMLISVCGNNINGPVLTSGLYINPEALELTRAGILIVSEGSVDANAAFGGSVGQVPAGALVDPNVQAPPPLTQVPGQAPPPPAPPVTPAQDFLDPNASLPPPPPATYTVAGNKYTKEQLQAGGYSEAQIQEALDS